MRKNDWILAGVILAIAMAVFLLYFINSQKDAEVVIVRVDNEVYGIYDLSEEQIIVINKVNTLLIKDGKAVMTAADCPDQLCVHQAPISKNQESIICLPNKVVVIIENNQEDQ